MFRESQKIECGQALAGRASQLKRCLHAVDECLFSKLSNARTNKVNIQPFSAQALSILSSAVQALATYRCKLGLHRENKYFLVQSKNSRVRELMFNPSQVLFIRLAAGRVAS